MRAASRGPQTSTHSVVPTRRSPATANTATRMQCPHGAARLAPCEVRHILCAWRLMAHKHRWPTRHIGAHQRFIMPLHTIAVSVQCVCTSRAALEPRLGALGTYEALATMGLWARPHTPAGIIPNPMRKRTHACARAHTHTHTHTHHTHHAPPTHPTHPLSIPIHSKHPPPHTTRSTHGATSPCACLPCAASV